MTEIAPGTTVQIIQPGLVVPLGVAKGDTGPAGPPGGSDESFAAWINDTTPSSTRSAINSVNATASTADRARANHTGTQPASTITGLAAVATSGSASDITTGSLPNAVLPPLAISETFPVASEAAMLAVSAQQGDVAIRTDLNKSFILRTNSPSVLGDWSELLTPTDAVTSVAGKVGVVSLVPSDVGAAAATHTHAPADVTGFDEQVRDAMGAALVAGTNITITPNDAGDTITIAAGGGGGTQIEPYVFRKAGTLAIASGAERIYLEGNYTVETVRAAVNENPVGASLICDVNKNGTTIYTTQANRPTIAADGAVYIRSHTSGISNASGTTVAATIATADVAVGNTLVAWWASDNTDTGTPDVSSISRPAGETNSWVKIAQHDSSTPTSSGGVVGEMWAITTTVVWPVSTAVTVTQSASQSDKIVQLKEFSGVTTTIRGTAGTGTATNSTPTASTSGTALVAGDLVLGGGSFEYGSSGTITGDADTTNGSWAGTVINYTSTGTSGDIGAISQYKVVTATGAQTYNPTHSLSVDSGAAVVALAQATGPGTATANNPDITTFAAGDYITVDVDQVGSTIAGSDLTVTVRLQKT